ncbi:kinetochore-associated Ndc80 complex subunit SPC24 [Sporobolomyces salmoneus]|uniref:kinetochore-associated Ndc80 complex subunit SPC24 n=1 Tax=Sporobolomyces salmoneus TaxID=183962 RepID=UPI0031708D3D
MATYDTPEHDFEEAFGPLFDSLWKTFALKDESTLDQPSPDPEEGIDDDVENVLLVERKTKEWRNHTKDLVDHAREQLRGIKLDYKSAVTASQRSSTIPSTTDHQRQLETMFQQTLQTVKLNSELDQQVMELQGELVRLNQELKEQEKEVVQVGELNGDVLKLKMYRDLGFTPIPNEQGKFTKIIVRSATSQQARTIELDPSINDFQWCNFLWELNGSKVVNTE